jgi:RNA polymerase sigma-70 factor (ECF subfamily)
LTERFDSLLALLVERTGNRQMSTVSESSRDARVVLDTPAHRALRQQLEWAVRRMCPRSLAADAEDLVQESFIRLLRAHKLDGDAELAPAYLKKVAYSAVIDEIRRRRKQLAENPAMRVDVEVAADELVAASSDTALGHAIEAGMQSLSDDRRRALTLHLLGYSGTEVATLLGCNVKRADNLTHRGLAQVREYLLRLGLKP